MDLQADGDLGADHSPVETRGCICARRKGAYPSSVLMNVIPAQVAGVPRLSWLPPATGGKDGINPYILVARPRPALRRSTALEELRRLRRWPTVRRPFPRLIKFAVPAIFTLRWPSEKYMVRSILTAWPVLARLRYWPMTAGCFVYCGGFTLPSRA